MRPTYTKARSGTVFHSLACGKTLKLNYNSIYYHFFEGIKFSNPQITVLALDELISLYSAASLQK